MAFLSYRWGKGRSRDVKELRARLPPPSKHLASILPQLFPQLLIRIAGQHPPSESEAVASCRDEGLSFLGLFLVEFYCRIHCFLLSLFAGGWGLGCLLCMFCLQCSPLQTQCLKQAFLRNGWGVGWGRKWKGEQEEGREEDLWLVSKMN